MAVVYIWPNVSEEQFTSIELDLVHSGYSRKQEIEVREGVKVWRCK